MLAVAIALALIAAAIYFRPNREPSGSGPAEPDFGLGVTAFKGNRAMAERVKPPVNITDAEYTVVGINPDVKTDGGAPIPASDFSWASSDNDVVAVAETYTDRAGNVIDPGAYGRVITTPNGTGSAEVRVTHTPSGDVEILPINVGASAPGDFGLSVGTPARD